MMSTIRVAENSIVAEDFDVSSGAKEHPDRREEELHEQAKFDAIDAERENIEKTKERYKQQSDNQTIKQ